MALEAEYQSMQSTLEQELSISQEKLAKELQQAKAITERIEENKDLKQIKEELKTSREDAIKKRQQQSQLQQSVSELEKNISLIDSQYFAEERSNKDLAARLEQVIKA